MKVPFASLALACLAGPLGAQLTLEGDAPLAELGEHFDVIGDLNGDGFDDLIAGFPLFDGASVDIGRALVLSGIDGSVIRTHLGSALGDQFGSQVAAAGDVDADGVPDYIVAAIGYGPAKGAAYVYSGATGAQLLFMRGFVDGDALGAAVSRAGDIDGDGHEDLLIGATGVDGLRTDSGAVYVVSGADGTPLHTLLNAGWSSEYGQFVSDLGDVNADGVPDFLACATDLASGSQGGGGFTRVISGANGSTIRFHHGFGDGHGTTTHYGLGVSGVGDLDGDGVVDYAVGVMSWWSGFGWSTDFNEGKEIHFHSGATGNPMPGRTLFYTLDDSFYPVQPNNVGDVDGDGTTDMAYVTPADELVHVVSGATGNELTVLAAGETDVRFGATIRGIQDINADGNPDIAVGMPAFDGVVGQDSGAIRYLSVEACPAPANYCSTTVNSSGSPARIGSAGTTSILANNFILTASDCPANKPGMFFYGPTQISTPYADGTLCVGTGALGYFRVNPVAVTSSFGSVSLAIDNTQGILASGPGELAAGSTWNFQFWFRDPSGGATGFTFSDGLEVVFCP